MKSHKEESNRLLKIAKRNLKSFNYLKLGGVEYVVDATLFAQQAVEKSLKAILVSNGVNPPRIHTLLDLAMLVTNCGVNLPYAPEELDKLTPFAVTYRYEDEEVISINFSEATKLAEGIYAFAAKICKVD